MGKFTVFAFLLCALICNAASEGDKKEKVDLDDYIEKDSAKEELATAETSYYGHGHGYHHHGYHVPHYGGYGHHGYSPYHGHGHAHSFYTRGYGHGHGHGIPHYGHVGSAHVSYGTHIYHPQPYHHHHAYHG